MCTHLSSTLGIKYTNWSDIQITISEVHLISFNNWVAYKAPDSSVWTLALCELLYITKPVYNSSTGQN